MDDGKSKEYLYFHDIEFTINDFEKSLLPHIRSKALNNHFISIYKVKKSTERIKNPYLTPALKFEFYNFIKNLITKVESVENEFTLLNLLKNVKEELDLEYRYLNKNSNDIYL